MKLELDQKERDRFKTWNKQHLQDKHDGKEPYGGAIGGRITYMVTPTSLGTILSVKCASCGDEECLTDFDEW